MRIIGEISHPSMKITAFVYNDKISIKIEKHLMEHIIKFRDGSGILDIQDVERFLNPNLLLEVEKFLDQCARLRTQSILAMQSDLDEDFPIIV